MDMVDPQPTLVELLVRHVRRRREFLPQIGINSIAFHVGDRSHTSAEHLWAKIPQAYRQHATFYTDQYVVYAKVIPAAQHQAISKLARKTNHIERFNNTLRQRVSRLVRDALSFSKKLANHIGAIKLFICHYNLTRAVA